MGALARLADDGVDDAKCLLLAGSQAHGHSRLLGHVTGAPKDARTALGTDDRVDRVLEGQHHVADGDGERAARAALTGDDGDDGRAQRGHVGDVASDGLCLATLFRGGIGSGARGIHEGDHRQAQAFGQLEQAAGLAVALRMGHAEVAADVLLHLVALLVTQEHDPMVAHGGEATDQGWIVTEAPVAVQLDHVAGHAPHQLEGMGSLDVARHLHARPDGLAQGLVIDGRDGAVEGRIRIHGRDLLHIRLGPSHGWPPHRRCHGHRPAGCRWHRCGADRCAAADSAGGETPPRAARHAARPGR